MRRRSWSRTLRDFGRNIEDTWDDLVGDDTSQVEREFNRLIGRLQRRHGYSPDRALNELQDYWNTYSKRTRTLVEKQMEALPIYRKQKRTRWPWVLASVVAAIYIGASVLRRISAQVKEHGPNRAHDTSYRAHNGTGNTSRELRKSAAERNSVEERSEESFPASDPPATW